MFSTILSAAIYGIESRLIHVEVDVSDGLPMFNMVGYLSSQVKEAQERVRTALKNSGVKLQPKKVTVNLSPSDLRKTGPGFDLPIAVAVLAAYGYILEDTLGDTLFAGELSLNGEINPIQGILSIVSEAAKSGCKICFIPIENLKEGSVIEGIRVIGVSNLSEVMEYLNGVRQPESFSLRFDELLGKEQRTASEDFQDINGQDAAKRAAEVAVAGMHNLLMIGPPGSGKSMLAKRIPTILPPMTLEESLEISKVYSVAGLLSNDAPLLLQRPFRMPHHTLSAKSLAGGGMIPKPGEISLSHNGVLFLDEMPEFRKETLEILRQPMEEHRVCISRTGGRYVFPANFMLVGAMNPCKCGFFPDLNRCTCTEREVHQYLNRISTPLLDRFDVAAEVSAINYHDLAVKKENESSGDIRKRIIRAHEIQRSRYEGTTYRFNSDLNTEGIKRYCQLGEKEEKLLEAAFEKLKLSARAYHRIIKVARTIADLDEKESIASAHVSEAICYRSADKKFWRN